MKHPLKVGIAYNLKRKTGSDLEAEYDDEKTIRILAETIKSFGCDVILLEANATIIDTIKNTPDIVFNIAEGIQGRGREAEIPGFLNMLGIPYTGSDETALCLSLDKYLTKIIVQSAGIRIPKHQLFHNGHEKLNEKIKYPVILKPNQEGSSKGIFDMCTADDDRAFYPLLQRLLSQYQQPVIVEEFLTGREFTVGLLQEGDKIIVLPPMEIVYKKHFGKYDVYSYQVKKNYKECVEYHCPPQLTKAERDELEKAAKEIFVLFDCKDMTRIDFRCDAEGKLNFIELNPLPGLSKGYSDLPYAAEKMGISFENLIRRILRNALFRNNMDYDI